MTPKANYKNYAKERQTSQIVFADTKQATIQSLQKKYLIKDLKELQTSEIDRIFFVNAIIIIDSKSFLTDKREFWQQQLQALHENAKVILLEFPDDKGKIDTKVFGDEIFHLSLPVSVSEEILDSAIRTAFQALSMKLEILNLDLQYAYVFQDFKRLVDIGKALLNTRNFDELLNLILQETANLIGCDGVSIYVVERHNNEKAVIRFKKSLIALNFKEFVLPIDSNSIVGYVVKTKQTLLIDDAYEIPADAPYSIDKHFDTTSNYRTRSMLVIPMQNNSNKVVGAIQLINRKISSSVKLTFEQMQSGEGILNFDEQTVELASAMAGQAAVAIENNRLVSEIQQLFEGFVSASVKAIEQRDPSTKGHSDRVAALTVLLAQEVSQDHKHFIAQHFSEKQIRELRYAALLHDFGKVGVREKVLTKEKKLYPEEFDLMRLRFRYIRKVLENENQKKQIDFLKKNGRENFEMFELQCQMELQKKLEELQNMEETIVQSNEPTYYLKNSKDLLPSFVENAIFDGDIKIPYLNNHEFLSLSTSRGTLTPAERKEIESHVSHTYDFLKQIPWTSDLKNVPEIAHGHHEKLDGSGYPLGLTAEKISLQSKIMAIADIFDALNSTDRHYKKGIPLEKTLGILEEEASLNHIDKNLLNIFIKEKVYARALQNF